MFLSLQALMQLKPDGGTEEINGGRTCGRSEPVGGTSRDEDSIAAGVRGYMCAATLGKIRHRWTISSLDGVRVRVRGLVLLGIFGITDLVKKSFQFYNLLFSRLSKTARPLDFPGPF